MGSEIIILFAPFGLLCIAYFIYRLCPRGKRLYAALAVAGLWAVSWALITNARGSIGIFMVVVGVLLVGATVMHIIGTIVIAGAKKLSSRDSGA